VATIQNLVGANKIKDEWQKINNNFAALNSAKLEKSGDTMTGLLTALGGIDLEVSSVPPGKVGRMHANGATKQIYYHDGTDWREVWHNGNNPVTLGGTGYQRLASGLIIQWGAGHTSAGSLSVTLPIAYPSNHLITIPVAETGDVTANLTAASYTTSGVTILCSNAVENIFVRWYSIGY